MATRAVGPVGKALLWRIGEARAEYLRREGEDLLWADIGRAFGWAQGTTSAVKAGQRALTLEELPTLCDILRVRGPWLVFGDGPMSAQEQTEKARFLERERQRHPERQDETPAAERAKLKVR